MQARHLLTAHDGKTYRLCTIVCVYYFISIIATGRQKEV